MPIKLLHHKSWHVYSKDNIERVKKDEATEKARIEAHEVTSRQDESQRRLNGLRSGEAYRESDVGGDLTQAVSETGSTKRKRGNDIGFLEKQLKQTAKGCSPQERASIPESEYVVSLAKDKQGRVKEDTFGKMALPKWYEEADRSERGDTGQTSKQMRTNEKSKSFLDPLHDMEQFLARKKAAKAERLRIQHETARTVEEYEPDRYHVPRKEHSRGRRTKRKHEDDTQGRTWSHRQHHGPG